MTSLIIDADYLAYRYAFANQTDVDWGDGVTTRDADMGAAVREIEALVEGWREMFKAERIVMALSDPEKNWRHDVLPTYKAHRGDSRRPELWLPLRDFLAEHYDAFVRPTLEGDDVVGILATSKTIIPGKKIVIGIDKDLQQVPCRLFNPVKNTRRVIQEDDADLFFYTQALAGDASDGYAGCPGIGPKKAAQYLSPEHREGLTPWDAVVLAYSAKGLSEDVALVQARVARICRHTDYDRKRKEVRLWNPP